MYGRRVSREKNIRLHHGCVNRTNREHLNGNQSVVLWFTGLSGAGKSTLAYSLEEALHKKGYRAFVLDGDNIRHGLSCDLDFSVDDQSENLRRIGEVTKLFFDSGSIVLVSVISPFIKDREKVRKLINSDNFFEIYVNCPIHVCEQRDTKGLYKLARSDKIKNIIALDSPYEAPTKPELTINTNQPTINKSVNKVMNFLKEKNY